MRILGGAIVWLALLTATADAATPATTTFRGDPTRDNRVTGAPEPGLGVLWARDLGGAVSYPVVAGDTVFVSARSAGSDYGTTVVALDLATGGVRWTRPIAGTYYWSGLAYDGGRLFVLDFDGDLTALAPATGATLWSKRLPGQYSFDSPPAARDGRVYAIGAGSGGTAYGVRASDGVVQWSRSLPTGGGSPAVDGTSAYVSLVCGHAYAFNRDSGATRWEHHGDCTGGGDVTPAVHNGLLYPLGDSNAIYAASSGAPQGSADFQGAPAFADGVAYVPWAGGLRAVDARSWAGRWSSSVGGLSGEAPLVSAGHVYAGSSDGYVVALRRSDGVADWCASTAGEPVGTGTGNVDRPDSGPRRGRQPPARARRALPGRLRPGRRDARAVRAGAGAGGGRGRRILRGGGRGLPGHGRDRRLLHRHSHAVRAVADAVARAAERDRRPAPRGLAGASAGRRPSRARPSWWRPTRGRSTAGGAAGARATTAADGSWTLSVRPGRNTRYRALAAGLTSAEVPVYADLLARFRRRLLGGGRFRETFVVRGPRSVRLAAKRAHFYLMRKGARRARRPAASRCAACARASTPRRRRCTSSARHAGRSCSPATASAPPTPGVALRQPTGRAGPAGSRSRSPRARQPPMPPPASFSAAAERRSPTRPARRWRAAPRAGRPARPRRRRPGRASPPRAAPATSDSSFSRCSVSSAVTAWWLSSTIRWTSWSISRCVSGDTSAAPGQQRPARLARAAPRPGRATRLIPQRPTIARAIPVSCSMSDSAPVVIVP